MRNMGMTLLVCLVVAGCGRMEEAGVRVASAEASAPAGDSSSGAKARYLAYEHSVSLNVEERRVADVHAAAEAACHKATAHDCVVLESNLVTGRYVEATLKVRARREGINELIAGLRTRGEVIRQSVTAEDLTGPIVDSAKHLEMLKDYRARLESLRGKAGADIDALIKVNEQLSRVQGEIEQQSGERARLVQRVETEILSLSISSSSGGSFWRPIADAIEDFGRNLSTAISSAITAIAFVIPWGILLLLGWWCGRRCWSWAKRRNAKS